jgi:hypothetical protein
LISRDRGEDVYLYQLNVGPDVGRKVFLNYLSEVYRLKEKTQRYIALTGNCTTSIGQHTVSYSPETRMN